MDGSEWFFLLFLLNFDDCCTTICKTKKNTNNFLLPSLIFIFDFFLLCLLMFSYLSYNYCKSGWDNWIGRLLLDLLLLIESVVWWMPMETNEKVVVCLGFKYGYVIDFMIAKAWLLARMGWRLKDEGWVSWRRGGVLLKRDWSTLGGR